MLCQNCKMHEATNHIHSVVNGIVRDAYLCSECAGSMHNKTVTHGDLFELLSSFLSNERESTVNTVKCECCGSSFEQISKSGRVGCGNCYKTFEKQLEPALVRIHGRTSHVGKRLNNVDINSSYCSENKEDTIIKLKEELKIAIANEEYEKAAVIRDKIKKETEE